MATAILSPGAARALVIGIAGGVAAFAAVAVLGRAPAAPRLDAGRDERPPVAELPAVGESPPRPVRRADALRAAAGALDPAPLPPGGWDELPSTTPRAVDPPARTTVAPVAAPAAGSAALPAELQQRAERAALEQQRAAARAEAQLRLQQELNEQVAAIRGLLADEQARKEAEAAAAQQRAAVAEGAVAALVAARGQLMSGDSRVVEVLDDVSPVLPAPAQEAVQNARTAVDSEDLHRAGYWVAVAIAETQRAQLAR